MTKSTREQEACNAYLKFLASKGATAENLALRSSTLLPLLPRLEGCPIEGNAYREQVEATLDHLERAAWPAFLTIAREFYYFWASDFKAIASMSGGGGYRIRQLPDPMPAVDLPTLWKSLDQEKFDLAETWALKAYVSALRDEGAEKSVVETRSKLVKLLLLQLRSAASKDNHHYRVAVDATLPCFALRETRVLFLIVVRDFYYFWIGDPDAASHVTLDIRQTGT
jgi:hypothetical protein